MTFTLKVKLGNAAMMTSDDVAGALREVADKLAGSGVDFDNADAYDKSGNIRDINGNTVGKWSVA